MDEGFEKAAEALDKIRKEAISIGLLDTAEKNAEKVLKEFFKNIGYTVNVTFNYLDGLPMLLGTGLSVIYWGNHRDLAYSPYCRKCQSLTKHPHSESHRDRPGGFSCRRI
ncbi:DUF4230 domain-containing protein [Bacillus sp. EB01]|uniref:DUF4230 domain-containing protein n=1 Tax=Bacillus sp. EB01 TaxID=1347086 RepID=UPI0005C7346A|nr:DUF4230 domain-containing protein [Bacillus sp. EB01]